MLETTAVAELAANFAGRLIQPGDPDYDRQRAVFNGMIDRRPALIARCTGDADVVAAVNFARAQELVVAVRSGATRSPATASATATAPSAAGTPPTRCTASRCGPTRRSPTTTSPGPVR